MDEAKVEREKVVREREEWRKPNWRKERREKQVHGEEKWMRTCVVVYITFSLSNPNQRRV